MTRITLALAALSLTALPALAHPGHLLDHGQGHSHIAAFAALGLAAAGGGVLLARALLRRRGRSVRAGRGAERNA